MLALETGRVDARGWIAVSEEGRLGLVTSATRGPHGYGGIDLEHEGPWRSVLPTFLGLASAWARSGETLADWVRARWGSADVPPPGATRRMEEICSNNGALFASKPRRGRAG